VCNKNGRSKEREKGALFVFRHPKKYNKNCCSDSQSQFHEVPLKNLIADFSRTKDTASKRLKSLFLSIKEGKSWTTTLATKTNLTRTIAIA